MERTREYAESSPSIVTPLNRYLGYEEAASIAKQSLKERKTIREVVLERGHVDGGKLTVAAARRRPGRAGDDGRDQTRLTRRGAASSQLAGRVGGGLAQQLGNHGRIEVRSAAHPDAAAADRRLRQARRVGLCAIPPVHDGVDEHKEM